MSLLFNIPANPAVERFVDLSFEVSEKIIRLLEEKGFTQHDLAIRLGKKDSEISKWLTGNHNFTLRTIAAVETALEDKFITIDLDSEATYSVPMGDAFVSPVEYHSATMSMGPFAVVRVVTDANHAMHGLFTQPFDISN